MTPMSLHFLRVVVGVSIWVALAAADSSNNEKKKTVHQFQTCPMLERADAAASSYQAYQTYHGSEESCLRSQFNPVQAALNRDLTFHRLQSRHEYIHVPTAKTVLCPLEDDNSHDLLLQATPRKQHATGYDTPWIVENTASTAAIVSVSQHGNEDSKMTSSSSQASTAVDPNSRHVLQPGEWLALHTYEGQVVTVKEYNPITGQVGPILLQHRVGLIPVGKDSSNHNKAYGQARDAEDSGYWDDDTDEEHVVHGSSSWSVFADSSRHKSEKFYRPLRNETSAFQGQVCNALEVGFRNVGRHPLLAYYVRPNANKDADAAAANPQACPHEEEFKFHLGSMYATPVVDDFMWNWHSVQKYETSFMGHVFNFRLASNPNVIVDTVTLQPTRIVDCPRVPHKAWIGTATQPNNEAAGILKDNGISDQDSAGNKNNSLVTNVVGLCHETLSVGHNHSVVSGAGGVSDPSMNRRSISMGVLSV